MIEMLKILTKEKQTLEAPNSQPETTLLRGNGGDTSHSQGFALPRENPTTYASPSTAYPFNYGLAQIVKTPGLVIREPMRGVNLVDPLTVLDLDELAEKGKSG